MTTILLRFISQNRIFHHIHNHWFWLLHDVAVLLFKWYMPQRIFGGTTTTSTTAASTSIKWSVIGHNVVWEPFRNRRQQRPLHWKQQQLQHQNDDQLGKSTKVVLGLGMMMMTTDEIHHYSVYNNIYDYYEWHQFTKKIRS